MAAQEQISTAGAEHLHVYADCHYHPFPHVYRFPSVVFPLGAGRARRASQAGVKENTKVTNKIKDRTRETFRACVLPGTHKTLSPIPDYVWIGSSGTNDFLIALWSDK